MGPHPPSPAVTRTNIHLRFLSLFTLHIEKQRLYHDIVILENKQTQLVKSDLVFDVGLVGISVDYKH